MILAATWTQAQAVIALLSTPKVLYMSRDQNEDGNVQVVGAVDAAGVELIVILTGVPPTVSTVTGVYGSAVRIDGFAGAGGSPLNIV